MIFQKKEKTKQISQAGTSSAETEQKAKKNSDAEEHRRGKSKDIDAERHPEEQMFKLLECDFGYAYLG